MIASGDLVSSSIARRDDSRAQCNGPDSALDRDCNAVRGVLSDSLSSAEQATARNA